MQVVDPTILYLTLLGVLYVLAIGIIVKMSGLRERKVGLMVLYVALSLVWTTSQILARSDRLAFIADDVLRRVFLYGTPVVTLLFLELTHMFLRLERTYWVWWTLGTIWLAAVVVLNEGLLDLPERMWVGLGWTVHHHLITTLTLIVGWGLLMGRATFLTARSYRRTQQPLHKNRIAYWAMTLELTIASAVLFFAKREVLACGFHLLGVVNGAYAILTYRLPDIRQMTRQAISYLIVTLLSAAVYAAGFLAARHVFQTVLGYSPLLAGMAMALVLAVLFEPLLDSAQRLVSRIASGGAYDPSRTLREYGISISNILDLERLATVAMGLISEAMEIKRGALFVVHHVEDGGDGIAGRGVVHLRGVMGMGKGSLPSKVMSYQSPVVDYLCREHRPLTQYDVDLLPRFQEMSSDDRAWLNSLDMDVYVPIYAKDEWIGMLALGPKTSGDRYFEDDLTLLSTLADQTAVALENARLFDDLKAQNLENERLNRELTVANRELARLDQAKSDFIDIASHELRTPLTQVHGYNDILSAMIKRGTLTLESGSEMIGGISRAVGRLEEVVDTMFDVSRLDTETLALSPAPTSVASIVRMAVDDWAEALEERRQTLTTDGLRDLPTINADGTRLMQVFSHLIQNAIKYTPDGGDIRITGHLRGEDLPPEEQEIEIVVADTGIGIAPDELERIFDKFYRVGDALLHSTGRTKFKGAGPGLGLAIARGIVEAHDGRIWAESPGYDEDTCPGSEFHIILPVA